MNLRGPNGQRLCNRSARRRNYVFTLNNPTDQETAYFLRLLESGETRARKFIRYVVFQTEHPENGTRHFQGYVEFTKPLRLQAAKDSMGTNRIAMFPRRGTQEEAAEYAKKEDTRVDGPRGEAGTQAAKNTKEALLELTQDLRDGKGINYVLQQYPVQTLMYGEKIMDYAISLKPERSWPMDIEIYVGPSGTGKSTTAKTENPNAYHCPWPTGGRWWWPHYQGEDCVILDEFRHQIKMDVMLKLFDRHPMFVEAKGRTMKMISKKLIITTNIDPRDWYPKLDADSKDPLRRRIQEFAKIYDFEEDHSYPNFVKNLRTRRFRFNPKVTEETGYDFSTRDTM